MENRNEANSKKVATSKNTTDVPKKVLCPRQTRVLYRLLRSPATVRQLRPYTGNNIPETISQLRKKNIAIDMTWKKGVGRDGVMRRFGVYHLSSESKRVTRLLLGDD